MKKRIVLSFVFILLIISSVAIYKYVLEKDRYSSVSIVPENRNDLPLYDGLEFQENHYLIKGNHWNNIYEFYRDTLPNHGWKLVFKQASIEDSGGFMLRFQKKDKELHIGGGWNPYANETETTFDLNPVLHKTMWIDQKPRSICVYLNKNAVNCNKITDQNKIEQFIKMVDEDAVNKDDAPLQKEFGIVDVNGEKIEIHYDPLLPSFTLKKADERKQMKPEALLELLGLTHLQER